MRNFVNRKSVRDLLKKFSKSEINMEEFQDLKSQVSKRDCLRFLCFFYQNIFKCKSLSYLSNYRIVISVIMVL